MAVGLAVLFVLFIAHTLVAAAAVVSALRGRQWLAGACAAAAGAVFDVQALPPWPPRISLLVVGGSFAACALGIGSVSLAARRAPNAEVERETASRSSMLVALASIDLVVVVTILFSTLFVGRD